MQLNKAVGETDGMTQQDAALVEETAAAADMMRRHAFELASPTGTLRSHVARDALPSLIATLSGPHAVWPCCHRYIGNIQNVRLTITGDYFRTLQLQPMCCIIGNQPGTLSLQQKWSISLNSTRDAAEMTKLLRYE